MKIYYAIFEFTGNGIVVDFPDLPGCISYGKNMKEAYLNTIKAMQLWFDYADKKFIPKNIRSFETLRKEYPSKDIMGFVR